MREIAQASGSGGTVNLLGAYPQYGPALVLEKRAARLTTIVVPGVKEPAQFDAALASILELPPNLRVEPLTALACRIPYLPADARLERLDRAFSAIDTLPMQHRSEPLDVLIYFLHVAPLAARPDRFDRAFRAIGMLPMEHRGAPLTTLASQILALPQGERPQRFDRLLRVIGQLPMEHRGRPLWKLLECMDHLPAGAQLERYDKFLDILEADETVSGECRTMSLRFLVSRFATLPGAAQPERFSRILKVVGKLPLEDRDRALVEVRGKISQLPRKAQPAAHKAVALSRLCLEVDLKILTCRS